MPWIQSHSELDRSLKAIRLMTAMRWSKNETIGFLHRFWWTVLEVSPSGDVTPLSLPEVMSEALSMKPDVCSKVWEKMIDPGINFIEKRGDRFFVHDWLDYVSRYLSESKFKNHPDKMEEVLKNYGREKGTKNPPEIPPENPSEDNPRNILGQSEVDKIREEYIRDNKTPYTPLPEFSRRDGRSVRELWKESFDEYLKNVTEGYQELLTDKEWISQLEKYSPEVDIKLSLEKAFKLFWATEAGWAYKRKSRTKNLNWKLTFQNAISQSMNRVFKNKTQLKQTKSDEIYAMAKEIQSGGLNGKS